jgi:hypothetical protein
MLKHLLVPVVAGAVLAAALPAAAANAETVRPDGGMQAAGFDEAVALANGYKIVTLPDGSRTSVRKDQAAAVEAGIAEPTGAVVLPSATGEVSRDLFDAEDGECGTAYVYLYAMGGAQAELGTGFIVRPDWPGVLYINWRVDITDNGGSSTQAGYSAARGTHTFRAAPRILGLTRGRATATVPWYSIVVLLDGTVCYSLEPSTEENIT